MPLHGPLCAGLVAGDPDVDRRDLDAADGADDLRAALPLHHERRHVPDETAGLLRRVGQAGDVLGDELALGRRERRDLHRIVGDRELPRLALAGEGDLRTRVRQQEACADDRARAAPQRGRQVRDVVRVRVRLQRKRLDLEHPLRPQEPRELRLVERLVVEPTDIRDECRRQRCLLRRRRAGAGQRQKRRQRGNRRYERSDGPFAYLHVPSLRVSLPP